MERAATHFLRLHKSGISALCSGVIDPDYGITSPVLFSGDIDGEVTIWDLITRRPIFTSKICNEQVVDIQFLEGKYLSLLCKDHKLRLYELLKLGAIVKQSDFGGGDKVDLKQIFEVSVNTLNFANYVLTYLGNNKFELVTCHTQDAHFIDIYEFETPELNSLKRFSKAIDFLPMLRDRFGDNLLPKMDGLGIIMKFYKVNEVVYCGFESGYVIAFRRYRNKPLYRKRVSGFIGKPINECASGISKLLQHENVETSSSVNDLELDNVIEIVLVDRAHYPDPVLDMAPNPKKNGIICSSTTNKLVLTSVDEQYLAGPNSAYIFKSDEYLLDKKNCLLMSTNLKIDGSAVKDMMCKNIGFVLSLGDYIITGNWSGKTYIGRIESDKAVLAAAKSRSLIEVNESPVGNIQQDKSIQKSSKHTKIGAMTGFEVKDKEPDKLMCKNKELTPGKLRRLNAFVQSKWYFIGYTDGTIGLYRAE